MLRMGSKTGVKSKLVSPNPKRQFIVMVHSGPHAKNYKTDENLWAKYII